MSILDEILSSNDDAFFCEKADVESPLPHVKESDQVSGILQNKKRKRDDLEEGEIEEWYSVCTGFFFDTTIMKKVPGCVECHNGKFCGRPRKV